MQYGNNDKKISGNNIDIKSNNGYNFLLFSNVLLNSKSNVAVYQGHINVTLEVAKCSQSAG